MMHYVHEFVVWRCQQNATEGWVGIDFIGCQILQYHVFKGLLEMFPAVRKSNEKYKIPCNRLFSKVPFYFFF